MATFLAELRARDDAHTSTPAMSFAEFNTLIGATDQMTLADRYRD
jgi:hypothetical protein